mgnify:FL=1
MGIAQNLVKRRTKIRLDNIARLIGEFADVKVKFASIPTACTDGKTIHIRVGDFSDEHYVNMAIGLAFHEGGHIKHTNFNVGKCLGPKWFKILNGLEDIRMESEVQREFKGARKYLHYVNKDLFCNGDVHEYTSPFSLIHDYILYRGFAEFNGNIFMKPKMLKMREQLYALLGKKGAAQAEYLIGGVQYAEDTQDCLLLTLELRDFLQEFEPAPQEPQNTAGDDSDADTDSSNDSDADDSGNTTTGEASSDADSSDEADDSAQPTINQYQNNPFLESQIDDSECMQDVHEAIREIVNQMADEFSEHHEDEVLENLEYLSNDVGTIDFPSQGYDYDPDFDSVKAQTNQLRLIFKRALLDQARVRRNYVRDGGVLDGQRILDLVTSPSTACIFRNEKRAKATSAAVSIIVDASSSMSHHSSDAPDPSAPAPYKVANRAAFAMANALDSLRNVEVEVRHMVDNGTLLTKHFHQRVDERRFAVCPEWCTPTAEVVKGAIASLNGHRYSRKLIIVVTDGVPDSVSDLRDAVSDAQIVGINVKGIGIHCPTYGIDDGVIINDITELSSQLMLAVKQGIF